MLFIKKKHCTKVSSNPIGIDLNSLNKVRLSSIQISQMTIDIF
jgi:hypothetical protein